ncbi:HNH endonuclease signature motif containing protein [Nocardioides sp. URHA0032]|uniref:HNH endonuclease signature motif containing protein n=1 Tax=Nocardioides sp. URHA0032 TaxID=1380388 RepID=UPI0009DF809E|nr:HNH endonuclease signature motif containing protein [Nocardioides sp. URHA0032]
MTAMATPRHRVSVAVAQMRDLAGSVTDASVWSMEPAETTATLVEISRLKARVAELEARVAEHADDEQVDAWAHRTRQTKPVVLGQVKLGQALVTRGHVRDALAAGDLVVEQARVIVAALDQLPGDLDTALVEKAERHLVAAGREHTAPTLRILGKRLMDVVAPGLADEFEARQLAREEAEALLATTFTMVDDGHGKCHGKFTVPSLHGAALKKMLLAIAAPKHRTATDGPAAPGAGVVPRPGRERLGRAFCELIERYPAHRLPQTGGVSATVVVTMTLDSLLGKLEQAALLDTGEKITPATARRLACEAGIIPAVLGGNSEVLDLGRTRRFHTKAQRVAIGIRDKGCTEPGCDWPPAMCHVHHDIPWSRGGPTDLEHGRLLCPRHHTRFHRRS